MNKKDNLKKVLIVDDDPDVQFIISSLLKENKYQVYNASSCKVAVEEIEKISPDLILLDVVLPDGNGIKLLEREKKLISNIPVVVITGFPDIENAVKAIKMGAYDYVTKPFDTDNLLAIIKQALGENFEKDLKLKHRLSTKDRENIVYKMGKSDAIQKLIESIEIVAPTDFSVLIEGESGSGKEQVSKWIHQHSDRNKGPWVPVDCGAIPETLFESEFFGYEKGAFTGATQTKKGYFEEADQGTLFLDELSSLPISMQMKFLRALQNRDNEIYRVGGTRPIRIDVRIVCASSDSVLDKIHEGKFRPALYYRINEFKIKVPSLRERPEDILFLADRIAWETAAELGTAIPGFSDRVKKILTQYEWPGNVRELINVIRRATLLAEKKITVRCLPYEIKRSQEATDADTSIDVLLKNDLSWKELKKIYTRRYEKKLLERVLQKTDGNISAAARMLQMDYKTLFTKIKRLDIIRVE